MARKRAENRWKDIDGGAAFVIPYTVLRSANFRRLSRDAKALILDLAPQYTGFNNGYLCCGWTLMSELPAWKSPVTLRLAMLELEHYGLIERTRQGGRNKATLHAFTWRRVDQKAGDPLDPGHGLSTTPSNAWKESKTEFRRPDKPSPSRSKALREAA